jgi:hypothetical protein
MKYRFLLFTLLTFILVFTYSKNHGQALQITSPNITIAACPGEWIQYNVNNNANPIPTCFYTWTVTNGEIDGGYQDGNIATISGYNVQLVRIRWFEVDKIKIGNIVIKAESCNNAFASKGLITPP